MATGKKAIPKLKVVPKPKPPAPRQLKATKPARPEPEPEPARMSAEAAAVRKHCGMGDPTRDRVAEFLALSTREMVHDLLLHPEEWLDWPSPQFAGKKPNELIGTESEVRVRDILIAYSLGMF